MSDRCLTLKEQVNQNRQVKGSGCRDFGEEVGGFVEGGEGDRAGMVARPEAADGLPLFQQV
jgi:hypothetical protein